jgi:hypothetical protein
VRGDVSGYRQRSSMWGEELLNELFEALSGSQCPAGLLICASPGTRL